MCQNCSYREKWDKITELIDTCVPATETIINILKELGAPAFPEMIGIDYDMVYDSIIVAKEVRNRYTLLQLLWDLGIEEEMAHELVDWLKTQKG